MTSWSDIHIPLQLYRNQWGRKIDVAIEIKFFKSYMPLSQKVNPLVSWNCCGPLRLADLHQKKINIKQEGII